MKHHDVYVLICLHGKRFENFQNSRRKSCKTVDSVSICVKIQKLTESWQFEDLKTRSSNGVKIEKKIRAKFMEKHLISLL